MVHFFSEGALKVTFIATNVAVHCSKFSGLPYNLLEEITTTAVSLLLTTVHDIVCVTLYQTSVIFMNKIFKNFNNNQDILTIFSTGVFCVL